MYCIGECENDEISMGRSVYGIGETICDIIFKEGQPQAAKAGGSTFNAMISLGRMGVNTSFISKIGDDQLGRMIIQFMKDNQVSPDLLTIWEGHKTDVALAFLNEKGDAEYSFYKEYDKQFVEAAIPSFKKDDILLFGSYFALNPILRPLVEKVVEAAKAASAIIYYDPNFRSSHAHEVDLLQPILSYNMNMATIVRGSDEDFETIFKGEYSPDILASMVPQLIVTKNSAGVEVMDKGLHFTVPAQPLVPVSTIGAGDSFNAGCIYALLKYGIGFDELQTMTKTTWTRVVDMAVAFASDVCQSYENYISLEFADKLKRAE